MLPGPAISLAVTFRMLQGSPRNVPYSPAEPGLAPIFPDMPGMAGMLIFL